jgi:vWA-MoxR associated protein C-terminal domain/Effector-associated domain 2/vWA-MoxR associated protein middle region 0
MPSSDSDTKSARKLSRDKIEPLVEKLLECPHIQDLESRNEIIDSLRPQIARSIKHHSDDKIHVTRMVNACLDYPLGLQELTDRLRFYEEDSRPMQEVDDYMETLFPGVVTFKQFEALNEIVQGKHWPSDLLKKVYEISAPPGYSLPIIAYETKLLSALLNRLAGAVKQTDGSLPLLNFVATLMQKLSGDPTQNELRKWVVQTALERGVKNPCEDRPEEMQAKVPTLSVPRTPQILPLEDQPEEMQAKVLSFLQIAFEPLSSHILNKDTQHAFRVKAWLWDTHSEPKIDFYHKDIVFQPEILPELFYNIINEGTGRVKNHPGQLMIELFLPYALFTSDLNEWKIKIDENEFNSITKEYPVVVRSLERLTEPNEIRFKKWSDYWDKLEKSTRNMQLKFFSQQEYEKAQGDFINVLRGSLNQGKFPVLTFVPGPIPLDKPHPLRTIVNVGTPIAFWLRRYPDGFKETEIRQAIKNLLANHDFSILPLALWQERIDAIERGDTQHLTQYLILLWDNPQRVPRDLNTSTMPHSSENGEKDNGSLADLNTEGPAGL